MSKVHLYLDEDETFFCSKCFGLGIENVVIRNPHINNGKPQSLLVCKDCGGTDIQSVPSFKDYEEICKKNNINLLKNKNGFNF